MKKAKDMSKLHEDRESTMKEGKETMMEKKGYKETTSGKMVKAAKGAMTKSQKKIGKVMKEFKKGELHSGKKGPVVKNPKQAIAIALSEAGQSKMKKAASGKMINKDTTEEQLDIYENAMSKPPFKTKKSEGGLSGNQSKLDVNKDGQISGEDFKMLRTKNKRGGGMAERGMGQAFSQGGSVRGTGAAIRGTRPAKLY
jgi:hypothetical protein